MKVKTVLRILILALIVMWVLTTFRLSHQNGETSSNLSRKVAQIFVSDEEKVDKIEPYIRKLAHLSEYAVGRWVISSIIFNL